MMKYSPQELQSWLSALYRTATVRNPRLNVVPYGYNLTFTALAQNTSASQQLSITANADFVLLGVFHRAQIAAAQTISSKTAPFVRMLITDSGSNEQFTNSAVDLENYSTNSAYENGMSFPRWIGGRTALTVSVTNFAPTAETYATLDLFFSGVLVRGFSNR